MISSSEVQEALYSFLSSTFKGENFGKDKLDLSLEREMFALLGSGSLSEYEIKQLPKNKRHFIYELCTQYLMFVSMNPQLPFPPGFLDGCSHSDLGKEILNYMTEHKWPFPQMLGKAR